ncbi:MAG: hypothetical protein ACXVHP_07955 [Methanobacterium sp.]
MRLLPSSNPLMWFCHRSPQTLFLGPRKPYGFSEAIKTFGFGASKIEDFRKL